LMTCPNHSNLLTLISVTISGDLYIFCISRLFLILHTLVHISIHKFSLESFFPPQ
jgi:hypothetical protein